MNVASFAAAQILRAVPRVRLSRAVGRLCEAQVPEPINRWLTLAYARVYRADLSEAERPAQGYPSFDAFFTRRLKPGARPIGSAAVVSPADGIVAAAGRLAENAVLVAKGQPYSVAELTGIARDATRYAGGYFAIIYLAPGNYHRVHAPVDGRITELQATYGDLFPVNAIGERHIPQLLVRNQRASIAIETEGLGRVTVVMVGATVVGRIEITERPDFLIDGNGRSRGPGAYAALDVPVRRGDEIGIFHLGSTVVLLTEPELPLSFSLGPIRYGQPAMGGPHE